MQALSTRMPDASITPPPISSPRPVHLYAGGIRVRVDVDDGGCFAASACAARASENAGCCACSGPAASVMPSRTTSTVLMARPSLIDRRCWIAVDPGWIDSVPAHSVNEDIRDRDRERHGCGVRRLAVSAGQAVFVGLRVETPGDRSMTEPAVAVGQAAIAIEKIVVRVGRERALARE